MLRKKRAKEIHVEVSGLWFKKKLRWLVLGNTYNYQHQTARNVCILLLERPSGLYDDI